MLRGLWAPSVVYAIALWLVVFLVTALLSALGVPGEFLIGGVILLLVTLFMCWTLGTRLRFISVSQGVEVGILWLLVNVLLDYLVLVLGFHTGDLSVFLLWSVWGRYLLLLLIPVLLASRRRTN